MTERFHVGHPPQALPRPWRRAIRTFTLALFVAVVVAGLLAWRYAGPRMTITVCVLLTAVVLMLSTKTARRRSRRGR